MLMNTAKCMLSMATRPYLVICYSRPMCIVQKLATVHLLWNINSLITEKEAWTRTAVVERSHKFAITDNHVEFFIPRSDTNETGDWFSTVNSGWKTQSFTVFFLITFVARHGEIVDLRVVLINCRWFYHLWKERADRRAILSGRATEASGPCGSSQQFDTNFVLHREFDIMAVLFR